MKAIVFEVNDWKKRVWPQIIADNGEAVRISWVCKKRLGFTVREHQAPMSDNEHFWEYQTQIHLDFYDDAMQTMFLLKYK